MELLMKKKRDCMCHNFLTTVYQFGLFLFGDSGGYMWFLDLSLYFHSADCVCLQEILDQIVDVDLVVNLKSTEDCLVNSHLSNGIYSPSREFFRMGRSRFNLSLQSQAQDGRLKPSCFSTDTLWKDKLRIYAEQVLIAVLL